MCPGTFRMKRTVGSLSHICAPASPNTSLKKIDFFCSAHSRVDETFPFFPKPQGDSRWRTRARCCSLLHLVTNGRLAGHNNVVHNPPRLPLPLPRPTWPFFDPFEFLFTLSVLANKAWGGLLHFRTENVGQESRDVNMKITQPISDFVQRRW